VLLTGVAGAVLVLAALGATGGWLLARSDADNRGSGPASSSPGGSSLPGGSPSPSDSRPPSPQYSEPSGATPSLSPAGADFALPEVVGSDFRDARQRLRDLRLGVQLVFGGGGEDQDVERTEPPGGTPVRAGLTVKLHVSGAPPTLRVPRLVGMTCPAAGREAADRGLTPRYEPARAGIVVRQDPEPSTEARWNDQITLHCEGGGATATPY
jgi:hypothetical protein